MFAGAPQSTCKSMSDPSMPEILSDNLVVLLPGSPCDNQQGLLLFLFKHTFYLLINFSWYIQNKVLKNNSLLVEL